MRRRAPLVVLAVALLACAVLVFRYGVKHVALPGIAFDVPIGWAVNADLQKSFGGSQELAVIGTAASIDCPIDDATCMFQARLSRSEIVVDVTLGRYLGYDFCAFATARPDLQARSDGIRIRETHYVRVDGRPAITLDYSFDTDGYREADGWRQWLIAAQGTSEAHYRIFAKWRGPGDDEFMAALDRMVASIRLTLSPYGVSANSECGDPFPPPA